MSTSGERHGSATAVPMSSKNPWTSFSGSMPKTTWTCSLRRRTHRILMTFYAMKRSGSVAENPGHHSPIRGWNRSLRDHLQGRGAAYLRLQTAPSGTQSSSHGYDIHIHIDSKLKGLS